MKETRRRVPRGPQYHSNLQQRNRIPEAELGKRLPPGPGRAAGWCSPVRPSGRPGWETRGVLESAPKGSREVVHFGQGLRRSPLVEHTGVTGAGSSLERWMGRIVVKVVGGVGNSGQAWSSCSQGPMVGGGPLGRSVRVTVCGIRTGHEGQVPELERQESHMPGKAHSRVIRRHKC